MGLNPEFPADLVIFTAEILNGKPNFFVQCIITHEAFIFNERHSPWF